MLLLLADFSAVKSKVFGLELVKARKVAAFRRYNFNVESTYTKVSPQQAAEQFILL